jgi:membrane protein implicated in regulation of membrane protease activity
MMEWLADLKWWHWWIVAAALAAIETLMPGAVAIWFAASALVIGALLLVIPMPWQLQLVLFGLLGFVAIAGYRMYARKNPDVSSEPTLNQRGAQHLGQILTLVDPIDHGFGRARAGDTVWKVSGPDLPVGAAVRVTGVRGAVLVVEPART